MTENTERVLYFGFWHNGEEVFVQYTDDDVYYKIHMYDDCANYYSATPVTDEIREKALSFVDDAQEEASSHDNVFYHLQPYLQKNGKWVSRSYCMPNLRNQA